MNELKKIADDLEQLSKTGQDLSEQVLKYFLENPNPSDEQFHAWAEEQEFDVHEAEAEAYKLASKFAGLVLGGTSKGEKPEGADEEQIKKGIEVELEHTSDKDLARKIVYDHLVESLDYYKYLEEMEKELEK